MGRYVHTWKWIKRSKRELEVNNGFPKSQISLDGPRQIEELGHDELEYFVDIDVVGGT